MKLIAGLGNPGKLYENTRHNIGFMAIDNYVKSLNLSFSNSKFDGIYVKTRINDNEVIFLKPQKFINLSGEVISKFMNFYKISTEDILIIHDDLDIECGKYKLKYKGTSGGHNGLKNIEKMIGTNIYKRIKIGISNNKLLDTKDYVLGKLSQEEEEKINSVIDISKKIIDDYLIMDFEKLMSKYN